MTVFRPKYGDAYMFDGNRWLYTFGDMGRVPDSSVFIDPITGEPECNAPELLVHQMIDLPTLAEMLGIDPRSVSQMLYRKEIPAPQLRAGSAGAPMWSKPVIDHWRSQRRGRDWAKGTVRKA